MKFYLFCTYESVWKTQNHVSIGLKKLCKLIVNLCSIVHHMFSIFFCTEHIQCGHSDSVFLLSDFGSKVDPLFRECKT